MDPPQGADVSGVFHQSQLPCREGPLDPTGHGLLVGRRLAASSCSSRPTDGPTLRAKVWEVGPIHQLSDLLECQLVWLTILLGEGSHGVCGGIPHAAVRAWGLLQVRGLVTNLGKLTQSEW